MAILFTIIGLFLSISIIYYFLKNDESFKYESPFPDNIIIALFIVIYIIFSMFLHTKLSNSFLLYSLNTSFLSLCFVVSYIDYYTKYIYDAVIFGFGLTFLVFRSIMGMEALTQSLISAGIGVVFYGLIYFLARLYYKKEAFGQGDILLMGVCALMLSPMLTVVACFLSFYVAAVVLVILKLAGKSFDRLQEIAFGPYICISSLLTLGFGDYVINLFAR